VCLVFRPGNVTICRRVFIVAKSACSLHCARLSVRPSACPRLSARLTLYGFLWNLILGTSMKICRETQNLVKIGRLGLPDTLHEGLSSVVAGGIKKPPWKRSLWVKYYRAFRIAEEVKILSERATMLLYTYIAYLALTEWSWLKTQCSDMHSSYVQCWHLQRILSWIKYRVITSLGSLCWKTLNT
jgi:hypothetical protein